MFLQTNYHDTGNHKARTNHCLGHIIYILKASMLKNFWLTQISQLSSKIKTVIMMCYLLNFSYRWFCVISITLIGGVLPLYRDAVGVILQPQPTGLSSGECELNSSFPLVLAQFQPVMVIRVRVPSIHQTHLFKKMKIFSLSNDFWSVSNWRT